jgi:hypothetical protein
VHLVGGDRLAGHLIDIGLDVRDQQEAAGTTPAVTSAPPNVDLVTFDSEVDRLTIPRDHEYRCAEYEHETDDGAK